MPNRKTHDQFVTEVFNLVGNDYSVDSKYTKSDIKLDMTHNVCGTSYKVDPHNFLRGNRCPNCNPRKLKTTEKFKKQVYDLVADQYEVIGEYLGGKVKLLMKHKECGSEYEITPSAFIHRGNRCPVCYRNRLNQCI